MDRAVSDEPPSPEGQPRRRLLAVSEEDRERIERHLERMPLERDALLLALPGFTASYVQWLAEYGVDLS